MDELLTKLIANYPVIMQVFAVIGVIRIINKPFFSFLHTVADATESVWDNEVLAKVEQSKVYKVVSYILDWTLSIKLPKKES